MSPRSQPHSRVPLRRRAMSNFLGTILFSAAVIAVSAPARATIDDWIGGDGFWDVASNWSMGLPNSSLDVENLTTATITHRSGADTVNNFVSDGAFDLSGGSIAGGLAGAASTFQVNNTFTMENATLSNFTVSPGTGGQAITFGYGYDSILSGVTLNYATIDLSNGGGSSNPVGGWVQIDAACNLSSVTAIDLASQARVSFDGARTLTGVAINGGYSTGTGSFVNIEGGTLTLGAGSSLNGQNLTVGDGYFTSGLGTFVNNGSIGGANSPDLTIAATNFINNTVVGSGTNNPGTIYITPANLTNNGTISAITGGTIYVAPTNAWVAAGTLSAVGDDAFLNNAPSKLYLGGTFTLGSSVPTTSGLGIIYLDGTLNNAGATFDPTLNIGGSQNFQLLNGRILGGSITHSDSLVFAGLQPAQPQNVYTAVDNRLDGVALDGGLNLSNGGWAHLVNGTTLGAAPTILLANGALVSFDGSRTLNNTTIEFNSSTSDIAPFGNNYAVIEGGSTLTIGPTSTVSGSYGFFFPALFTPGASTLVNNGKFEPNSGEIGITDEPVQLNFSGAQPPPTQTMNVTNGMTGLFQASGDRINVQTTSFDNEGAVTALANGNISVSANLTNTGSFAASGPSSEIDLFGYSAWTNNGTIAASGAGSTVLIQGQNVVLGAGTALSTSSTGQILVNATIDNTGATFDALTQVAGTHNLIFDNGGILNGNVSDSYSLTFAGPANAPTQFFTNGVFNNTLSGTLLDAGLNLGNGGWVTMTNGARLGLPSGLNLPTVTLNNGANLTLNESASFGADVAFGANGYSAYVNTLAVNSPYQLTIGEALVHGQNGVITGGGSLINNGGIYPDIAGGTITVTTASLTNNSTGVLGAFTANTNLIIEPTAFTNTGSIEASGGGNVLVFPSPSAPSPVIVSTSGTVQVGSGSTITFNAGFTQTAGMTEVDAGGALAATVPAANLFAINGGALVGTGTVQGSVQVSGTTIPENVAAGTPGTLTVTGVYNQNGDGTLQILAAANGQSSVLAAGSANLNGVLTLDFINGYVPQPGDSYTIMTFASSNGHFASLDELYSTLPTAPLEFTVDYLPTSVVIDARTLVTPGPESLLVFAVGLSGAGILWRRRSC